MTRPDIDAIDALLDKAKTHPWFGTGVPEVVAAVNALPALIAYIRELERERDALTAFHRQDAALAMREKCAQACAPYTKHPHTYASENADRYRGFRDGALACAAAIRGIEP